MWTSPFPFFHHALTLHMSVPAEETLKHVAISSSCRDRAVTTSILEGWP
jgi:hypothetical protein